MPKPTASPWPPTCSAGELSALLGLSGRRLRELAEEGVIPRTAGRYCTIEAVQAYAAHLREAATRRQQPAPELLAQAIDGRAQRARLAKLQADRVELELERERGQLVDADGIARHYVGLVTTARNRLRGVGSSVKGRCPWIEVAVVEAIEDEVDRALSEVADADDAD